MSAALYISIYFSPSISILSSPSFIHSFCPAVLSNSFLSSSPRSRLAMLAISGIVAQTLLFGKYGDAVFGPFR